MEKEISKEEFKKWYEKYAVPCGYSMDGWENTYENNGTLKFYVTEPESPLHNRLFLIGDSEKVRMVFMTEESEERFFDKPESPTNHNSS
jgi:hypothetical protein